MAIKPKDYFENRKCCSCGSKITTQGFGSPRWHKHRCDKKDCTHFLCNKCYNKVQYKLPNSHGSLKKLMRQCRIGDFHITKEMCKGCIGVEIVSRTLGLKNLNIELDNFNSDVDLSRHEKYGFIEVKTSSLRDGVWQFDIKEKQMSEKKFNTVFLLCMDYNEPWKDIEIVYAIPIEDITEHGLHINIRDNSLRYNKWHEKFKIDKNPYNDIYHNLDKKYCPFKM